MPSKEQLQLLHEFVRLCKQDPSLLRRPELTFYREWLESLGATIPPASTSASESSKSEAKTDAASPPQMEDEDDEGEGEDEEEEPESELEIDETGIIKEENKESLPMGDENVEASEEKVEQSNEKRAAAATAMEEGKYEDALRLFTEAICLNPGSAILHAKRAKVLISMGRPSSAILDCDKALMINPDSALSYKFRGRAHRLLGHWEEAYHDLSTACKLDYDDECNEWMKEVEPNAKKIQEHRRKQQRKQEDKAARRKAKTREQAKKRYEEQKQKKMDEPPRFSAGDMPSGFPGISELFSDPELLTAFQDPEVAEAFRDMSQNPANMTKYITNPKIAKIIGRLSSKLGGGTGDSFGAKMPFFGTGPPPSGNSSASQPQGSAGAKPDLDVD